MIHICAIVKNEIPYIQDWVEYHLNLGIDKITLYIHESETVPYKEILPHKEIELVEWNLPWTEHFRPQIRAYEHFAMKNQRDDDYTFFIDVDEYITPSINNITSPALPDLVNKMTMFNRDGLALPWVYYNANGQLHYEDNPVTERFTKVSPFNKTGGYIKSFFKNTSIVSASIHLTRTKRGLVDQDGNDNVLPGYNEYGSSTLNFCKERGWWYIRHYFTKSWEEFVQRRVFNRGANSGRFLDPEKFFAHNPDLACFREELISKLNLSQ